MSALDTLRTTELDYTPEANDGLPVMWWHNGDKKAKTAGSFYVKADSLYAPPAEPWQPVERFDNEDGFTCDFAHVVVIGYRMQAYRQESKDAPVIWLSQYEAGARFRTEALCIVEGINGLVVWSMKGLVGKAFTARNGGILETYKSTLLRDAATKAGRTLPVWTFWLPITSETDASGKIIYKDTGHGSFVTPPVLAFPTAKSTDELIEEYFVKAEMYRDGAAWHKEYEQWFKARRGNIAPSEETEESDPF